MIARFSRRVMMAVMIVIVVVMVVSVPMVVLGVIVLTIPVVAFNDLHARFVRRRLASPIAP